MATSMRKHGCESDLLFERKANVPKHIEWKQHYYRNAISQLNPRTAAEPRFRIAVTDSRYGDLLIKSVRMSAVVLYVTEITAPVRSLGFWQ